MEDPYVQLDSKKIEVIKLLHWKFESIVKSLNRRLTFRQKYKNPWMVELTETIHRDIFVQAFKAIRDFPTEFGRALQVVRDRKGTGTHYKITFHHLGCFRHHIHKLSGISKDELDKLFAKKSPTKGKIQVVVTEEKSAVVSFDCKKSLLKLTVYYSVTNRYGVVCSF